MNEFYYLQTRYDLLLSAEEMGGVSVWTIPIFTPVPLVQFPVVSANRYFVVLSGSVIIETENRTFSLNKNEDLYVPNGTRAFLRNAGNQQSKILMLCNGWGFERFIAATAATKPAVPLNPDLVEIASQFGVETKIIDVPQAPELGKWIMPRCQSHETCI